MAANNTPIFSRIGELSNDSLTGLPQSINLAANDFTGVSANYALIHTAGVEGTFVDYLRIKSRGTNVASALRVFINNGSANTTAANNFLWDDIVLPATTASAVAQTGPAIIMPMRLMMQPGFRIYVGLTTAVASGWGVIAVAGEY
jgi:hypothetical protein